MKRRICIFCEIWESGGIESFLHNVIGTMDRRDTEIDIVAAKLGDSVFTEPLTRQGVRFFMLSGSTRRLLKNYRMFRRLLNEGRYDVLHLNIYHSLSLYYAQLAKRAGVRRRIAHSHTSGLRKSATLWLKLLIHRCARKLFTASATDLWACAEDSARFLFDARLLAEKGWTMIPNGIDLERFAYRQDIRASVRRELNAEDKLIVANVGRLCQQKNQEFLLDVFADIAKTRENSLLLLVGKDEDRQAYLEEKAERLGIREKVVFYGLSSRVAELMQAMDVFVFPSRFEGLGLAPIEAQAAGLPVICSESEPREVTITSDIRFLSLRDAPSVWADAILDAVKEPRHGARWTEPRIDFDVKNVAETVRRAYWGEDQE